MLNVETLKVELLLYVISSRNPIHPAIYECLNDKHDAARDKTVYSIDVGREQRWVDAVAQRSALGSQVGNFFAKLKWVT